MTCERFGVHFVASPRHADLLLVTGPVTRNMEVPLRKTYEATPDPKLVVAVGDCARTCGVFRGSYAVAGSVDQIIPVDAFVSGCPPEPADILRGILAALDRLSARSAPPIGMPLTQALFLVDGPRPRVRGRGRRRSRRPRDRRAASPRWARSRARAPGWRWVSTR